MARGVQKGILVGVDLGATNLRVALVDRSGAVLASMRETLEDRAPSSVAASMCQMIRDVLSLEGLAMEEMAGLGVGVAGQVLGHSGVVLVGPNLGWRDVRFGALVERELGVHPRVVNDLSAAAWGESRAGAARGAQDVLLVFAGSGIGSGLILGGRLHEGAGGVAGELGHIKVEPGGRPCGCGERGCLEAYTGGHNIRVRLDELVQAGKARGILQAAGGEVEALGPAALELAAEQGDPEARELREEIARYLGWAIGNLITMLNPQKLVLGGGVLRGMPGLKGRTTEWVRATAGRAQLAQLSFLEPALGDDSGLVGAALLAAEG